MYKYSYLLTYLLEHLDSADLCQGESWSAVQIQMTPKI